MAKRVAVERVFDCWDDYVTFVEQPKKWVADYGNSVGPYSHARPFNGNCTWDDAVRMARFGWPEGCENLARAVAIARPERAIVASLTRDVAGDYPLIPAVVAGDPMNMIARRRSQVAATPVVRIDYNASLPGRISAGCMMNRGAALLSIVDALENRGYSCELRLIAKTHQNNHKQTARMAVLFKRAGEPLDIDRAAFALTHPATVRRFYFAFKEQFPELEQAFSPAYGHAHGLPDPTPWDDEPGSIYVDGANNDDYTPKAAMERMETLFASYLEN